VALCLGLGGAGVAERRMEADLFADPVVMSVQTDYQRIVLTRDGPDTRLFIDGALQFSSVDEYRYHEALVHPAMAAARGDRVLVLGGGDGLAVREVLRWAPASVTLVDLDPRMTTLFRDRPELAALNAGALADPRVEIVNADAFRWVRESATVYDAVVIDFPDPTNFALGKLYTRQFYRAVARRLSPGAPVTVQATSPLFSPSAYACILETLRDAGFVTRPYHAYVPAFGEWGFVLASVGVLPAFRPLPDGLRFLDALTLDRLFELPRDLVPLPAPVNRLDNQALVQLYEEDWRELGRHP
jgi:spermidine synthase